MMSSGAQLLGGSAGDRYVKTRKVRPGQGPWVSTWLNTSCRWLITPMRDPPSVSVACCELISGTKRSFSRLFKAYDTPSVDNVY